MSSAHHHVSTLRHICRPASFSLLIMIVMLPAAAHADCRCAIQNASPALSFEGHPLPASLPCGARVLASEKGELELASGLRLSLAAGTSLALPAAICGQKGGETQPSAVSGVVRLFSSTAQTVRLSDSIPAGIRTGEADAELALILRVEGAVELRGKGEPPMPARRDMNLVTGEMLRTGADGFAELALNDGSRVLIGPKQDFDPRTLLQ